MARTSQTSSWLALAMLGIESQQVIAMRLAKIAAGGRAAQDESLLMISEKIEAAAAAGHSLALGHSPDSIVRGYRKTVRANIKRLSK